MAGHIVVTARRQKANEYLPSAHSLGDGAAHSGWA